MVAERPGRGRGAGPGAQPRGETRRLFGLLAVLRATGDDTDEAEILRRFDDELLA